MNKEQPEQKNKPGTTDSQDYKNKNNRYYKKSRQSKSVNKNNADNSHKVQKAENKTEKTGKPTQKKNIENRQNRKRNVFDNKNKGILISVVVPLLDEEESLPELSLQLKAELNKLVGNRWEVIFVDDGSKDNSFKVIKEIHERTRNFKAIRFRKNYGKSAALNTGFKAARGKIIITMDADLQDDPAEIQNLINKLKDGYDLVSGWKKKRHDPFIKKFTSKIFNFFTSLSSGLKLHDFNCGLKAYRRECAASLDVYGEMHRYLPALAYWNGFKVAEIPVKHHKRRYGKTKYGVSRFIKGYLDLLTVLFTTRYFKRPLHFFGTIGSLFTLSGLVINSYLVYEWILGNTYLSNRPLALFGIALIIVGMQMISIGLIGEMIVKNSVDKFDVNIKEKIN